MSPILERYKVASTRVWENLVRAAQGSRGLVSESVPMHLWDRGNQFGVKIVESARRGNLTPSQFESLMTTLSPKADRVAIGSMYGRLTSPEQHVYRSAARELRHQLVGHASRDAGVVPQLNEAIRMFSRFNSPGHDIVTRTGRRVAGIPFSAPANMKSLELSVLENLPQREIDAYYRSLAGVAAGRATLGAGVGGAGYAGYRAYQNKLEAANQQKRRFWQY